MGKKQITDLLQDIYDFDDNNKRLKYCLQPLVVKPIDSINSSHNLINIFSPSDNSFIEPTNCWELIDGQQRLTTLWLILNCCDPDFTPYSIYYEHVRKIDDYYLTNAKEVIENWFSSYGPLEKDIKFDIRSKINRSIQFIWYQVEKENNSVEIFTKINMGIIGEPEYEKEYFTDKYVVTGHTPTGFIDTRYKGKIWQSNHHIAIDCGAVFGNPLGCICLDSFEEYYVE